jgi:CRISPR-associated protein Csh1
MVSGGFDQSQAWKNYPVCFQCAKELEMGKKYLDNYSHFNFFQFDYFIIPKPLLIQERDKIFHILKTFHDEGGEKVQITEKYETLMSDTKDEILNLLSTQENSFICNILIYEENNNEFKIDKCIEDIFPSRLKDLFNAKRTVDNILIFKNLEITIFNEKKKPEKKLFTFNFGCIYHFFGKERDSNTRTYFLDIVEKIFSGRPISYSLILSGIIRKIRKSFYQNAKLKTPTKESALQGLALLVYLNELRILSELQRGLPMTSQFNNIILDGSSETHKKVEEIFKKFPAFFDTSAKCAIYLEGVLCQKLLNIQYSEREATPFRTKLQGLKLDQKKVQTLLPDIQNKLEEYKKNYYRDLEQLIAALTRDSGKDWNLSKDEISFFFVLGMNLADEFTFEKQHEVKTND